MLARPLTNSRIGARLHISAKTHHVSAILAKLGVATREEAGRRAVEHGLAADHGVNAGERPVPR